MPELYIKVIDGLIDLLLRLFSRYFRFAMIRSEIFSGEL